jgi:hypothetical protein
MPSLPVTGMALLYVMRGCLLIGVAPSPVTLVCGPAQSLATLRCLVSVFRYRQVHVARGTCEAAHLLTTAACVMRLNRPCA